jgi:hypothetical protein
MPRDPLHAFWLSIMYALDGLPPSMVPSGLRLTDEMIEADFRLTPHTAEEFQEDAFSFLPEGELSRLKNAVEKVRAVSSNMGPRVVATRDERDEALPYFKIIVRVLEPDRFTDPETFKLGKKIERELAPVRPSHLDQLRFMSGLDSTDDPALWVWVYVAETGEYDDATFLARADEIENVLKPIARAVAPEGRVYFHFRTTSDLHDAQEVPA